MLTWALSLWVRRISSMSSTASIAWRFSIRICNRPWAKIPRQHNSSRQVRTSWISHVRKASNIGKHKIGPCVLPKPKVRIQKNTKKKKS